jgi:hypothetical protein
LAQALLLRGSSDFADQRLPNAHPALQGAPRRGRKIAMPTQHLGQDADWAQPRRC